MLSCVTLFSYAPWCPACKSLAPTWEQVAGWSDDLAIKVAHIDVTENPGNQSYYDIFLECTY